MADLFTNLYLCLVEAGPGAAHLGRFDILLAQDTLLQLELSTETTPIFTAPPAQHLPKNGCAGSDPPLARGLRLTPPEIGGSGQLCQRDL